MYVCIYVCMYCMYGSNRQSIAAAASSRPRTLIPPIAVEVVGRDRRPDVHPVHDRHRHPAGQMRLDVAVQVERAGVDHLVPERDPRRPLEHTRRGEAVPQRRCVQVEAARYLFHRVGDRAVVERAGAGTDQVGLVAVLVDRMRGLGGSGGVEHDLEDDVDPCTVDGTNDQGWIVGVGVGCGVGVEEEGRLVICLGVVQVAAAEGPVVVGAEAAEFEDVGCIGGGRGLVDGIRDQESFIEGDDGGSGVFAAVVDVCGPIYCAVAGCCRVVTVVVGARCVRLVRELCIAREYLICARICDADGVISGSLV